MTDTEMIDFMAGSTGIEPATSGLTVQCANQAAPRARLETSAGYTTSLRHATIDCSRSCARDSSGRLHALLRDLAHPPAERLEKRATGPRRRQPPKSKRASRRTKQ